MSGLSIIDCFNCPMTGVRLQLYRMIRENEVANSPITFEEFVMFMISNVITEDY